MKTLITVLAENSVGKSGLLGEHGFSAFIERNDEKYLFDTSPGISLPHNIKLLDKSLKGLNKIIISHGHYDHTGGLKWAVREAGGAEIVAHPDMFCRHSACSPKIEIRHQKIEIPKGEAVRYVGCPYTQAELEASGAHFNFFDHTEKIAPGLWFITGIERRPEYIPNDSRLVLPYQDHFVPDMINDDASLLLECEDASPILMLGCAHSGILNILAHVREKMGIRKLRAVIGGTHLMFSDSQDISLVIERLEEFSVERVGVSHCTGLKAAVELAKHFGERFVMASAGSVFEL
jgi:7,8-dihydropterin-6-yl-methyl-4-(beta-D-ribofuranosyl)aminobenzene 5'-phosphate synthase